MLIWAFGSKATAVLLDRAAGNSTTMNTPPAARTPVFKKCAAAYRSCLEYLGRCPVDGSAQSLIGSAAAYMVSQIRVDVRIARLRLAPKKCGRLHDHACLAESRDILLYLAGVNEHAALRIVGNNRWRVSHLL
jgi:hypothetical protein